MLLKISQIPQENTCVESFESCRSSDLQFSEKETPTQVLLCEICEIFKSTFFYITPPLAASAEPS